MILQLTCTAGTDWTEESLLVPVLSETVNDDESDDLINVNFFLRKLLLLTETVIFLVNSIGWKTSPFSISSQCSAASAMLSSF